MTSHHATRQHRGPLDHRSSFGQELIIESQHKVNDLLELSQRADTEIMRLALIIEAHKELATQQALIAEMGDSNSDYHAPPQTID